MKIKTFKDCEKAARGLSNYVDVEWIAYHYGIRTRAQEVQEIELEQAIRLGDLKKIGSLEFKAVSGSSFKKRAQEAEERLKNELLERDLDQAIKEGNAEKMKKILYDASEGSSTMMRAAEALDALLEERLEKALKAKDALVIEDIFRRQSDHGSAMHNKAIKAKIALLK